MPFWNSSDNRNINSVEAEASAMQVRHNDSEELALAEAPQGSDGSCVFVTSDEGDKRTFYRAKPMNAHEIAEYTISYHESLSGKITSAMDLSAHNREFHCMLNAYRRTTIRTAKCIRGLMTSNSRCLSSKVVNAFTNDQKEEYRRLEISARSIISQSISLIPAIYTVVAIADLNKNQQQQLNALAIHADDYSSYMESIINAMEKCKENKVLAAQSILLIFK